MEPAGLEPVLQQGLSVGAGTAHLRRTHAVYEPRSALRRLYGDQFETFKEVRTRLAPLYHRINAPSAAQGATA